MFIKKNIEVKVKFPDDLDLDDLEYPDYCLLNSDAVELNCDNMQCNECYFSASVFAALKEKYSDVSDE